jgi:hypothetical protein
MVSMTARKSRKIDTQRRGRIMLRLLTKISELILPGFSVISLVSHVILVPPETGGTLFPTLRVVSSASLTRRGSVGKSVTTRSVVTREKARWSS